MVGTLYIHGKLKIRSIQQIDIPDVAESHAASWRKAFRGILSDQLLDALVAEKLVSVWQNIIRRPNRTGSYGAFMNGKALSLRPKPGCQNGRARLSRR